jgi:hypothetical protein
MGWLVVPSFLTAMAAAVLLFLFLCRKQERRQSYFRAGIAALSEREWETFAQKDSRGLRRVMILVQTAGRFVDLDGLILNKIGAMLEIIGEHKQPEKELARYLIVGCIGAVPVLLVPFITQEAWYCALYPCFAAVLVYQNYQSLLKRYRSWQKEIQRDVPDLIDKLRISFASGRDYVSALIQVRASSGPKMARAIERLVSDIQSIGVARALDGFAAAFRMPVINKLASAVRIAVESGYQSAETYFVNIENDLREVRQVAMEELTRSKPEKVYQLYLVLSGLAIGTLCLKGWEIFSQVSELF